MSPHVGNFVQDLVEMAKAVEQVPILEGELGLTRTQRDEALRHNQGLEENIIRYKQQIEELNSRIRSLEVERDDASFRVLEAEDTAASVLNSARVAQAGLDAMIAKLDPPKPEPVKEPEPQEQGKTDTDGYHPPQVDDPRLDQPLPEAVHSISELPGQSVENPSASNPVGDGSHTGDASTMIAEKQSGAVPSSPEPTHGPYFGKRYMEVDGYVSYHDWVAGGGTYDDYYSGFGN